MRILLTMTFFFSCGTAYPQPPAETPQMVETLYWYAVKYPSEPLAMRFAKVIEPLRLANSPTRELSQEVRGKIIQALEKSDAQKASLLSAYEQARRAADAGTVRIPDAERRLPELIEWAKQYSDPQPVYCQPGFLTIGKHRIDEIVSLNFPAAASRETGLDVMHLGENITFTPIGDVLPVSTKKMNVLDFSVEIPSAEEFLEVFELLQNESGSGEVEPSGKVCIESGGKISVGVKLGKYGELSISTNLSSFGEVIQVGVSIEPKDQKPKDYLLVFWPRSDSIRTRK